MIITKTRQEIEIMRQAGRLVAQVLTMLEKEAQPGVTTEYLDGLAEDGIRQAGGEPAFKGYRGFPATICASVNEQVVHGIPGERRLREGDLLSVDVGVKWKGFYGDAAATFAVGKVSPQAQELLTVGREALNQGVSAVVSGGRISDIGHAIQSYVEGKGCSVVRDFVGHGIGSQMHESPHIPNFGAPGNGARIQPGMTLAIEPMVNQGDYRVQVLDDGWTVVTQDRSLSVHFEHTVAVTDDGVLVLTKG